jgi:hypothetical protein
MYYGSYIGPINLKVRGLPIKFANFDIRGIVRYEFVPYQLDKQSNKLIIWKY